MIDLHTHSTASDGTLTPEALVDLAARRGVRALALTDHDTIGGVAAAMARGGERGVEVIAGTELSCRWRGKGSLHLLGYFIRLDSSELVERLAWLQGRRQERAERMAAKLKQLGKEISFSRVQEIAGLGSMGRPHLAQALVEAGHVASLEQAFARYLSRGRPAFVENERLEIGDAIALLHAAHGIAVLAHPGTLSLRPQALATHLEKWMGQGLEGLEVFWSRHSSDQVTTYAALAEKLGLLITGGSDFHGENKPGIELGTGRNHSLQVPESALEALRAYHQRPR